MTGAEVTRHVLLSLTPVTTLVSRRIRPLVLEQGETFPAIRVQTISDIRTIHLRGSITLKRQRVQVDCYAQKTSGVDGYAQGRTVDQAAFGDGAGSGLCCFRGTVAGSPGVEVTSILPASDGVRETYEADDLKLYCFSRDYFVKWRS